MHILDSFKKKRSLAKGNGSLKQTANRFSASAHSIQTSIIVTFTAVSVISMLVLTVTLNQVFSRRAENIITNTNDQLLTQVSENLEDYLHNMRRISDAMYYDVIKSKDIGVSTINSEMNLIYEANKDNLISIALYRGDGSLVSAAPVAIEMSNANITSQSWFIEALSQIENLHFSTPHVQHIFQTTSYRYEWVVSLSQAVEITENGKTSMGVLLVDMSYSAMKGVLSTVNENLTGQYMYLSDSSGSLIYHPSQMQISFGNEEENNIEIATYDDGIHKENFQGEDRIVIVDTISYTGWKLVSVIPCDSMTMSLQSSYWYVALLVSVALLAVIFVTRTAAVHLSRPLIRLSNAIGNMESGFTLDPSIYEDGSSEVVELGETLRSYLNQIQRLMDDIVVEQEQKRKSELDVLQSQINPHFLYNTLDSIVWMIEGERYKEAVFMITQLAQLFRISLSKGKTIIPIEDEISHAKSYMAIQEYRYKQAFETVFNIEDGVKDSCTVKLIIQPVLENAIYHGIRDMQEDGLITVHGYFKGKDIYIDVQDNGYGMTKEEVDNLLKEKDRPLHSKHGSGVALINVHKRIQLRFGMQYGLTVESEPDVGTTVHIHIPSIPYTIENAQQLEEGTYHVNEATQK